MWIIQHRDTDEEAKKKTEADYRAMEENCAIVNASQGRDCALLHEECAQYHEDEDKKHK